MPDRVVREGILDSDKVNALSWAEEVFYRRLMSIADDFGRCDARVSVLRARLYPTKLDKVSDADVVKWLGECQKTGLVSVYQVDGKPYFEIIDFRQRLRAMKSRYPPSDAGIRCLPLADDSSPPTDDSHLSLETKRNESESEKRSGPSSPAPPRAPDKPVKAKKTRENFAPPDQEQMRGYFLKLVKEKWGEVKCCNEADSCLDHYVMNGWVQNKGKPVVDWRAAARQWIRRAMDGDFSRPPAPSQSKRIEGAPAPAQPSPVITPKLPEVQRELNFLYDRWCEYPGQVNVETVQAAHYNQLKTDGKIHFTVEQIDQIRKLAVAYGQENHQDEHGQIMRLMKAFGVLEFFKMLKTNKRETVYGMDRKQTEGAAAAG